MAKNTKLNLEATLAQLEATIDKLEEVSPGRIREDMGVTLEIEGQERPAVVANWLTMYLM